MMKIKKALITAGGYGTRFFPVTKSIQKEMLPILTKPLLDYLVEDCVKAGIQEIIFITRKGDTSVKSYYTEDKHLYNYLKKNNKLDKYEEIAGIHAKADFSFIEQPDKTYGTAIPVLLAKKKLQKEEGFLVLMGDDLIYHEDGLSETTLMLAEIEAKQTNALMSCIEVPWEITHKYGIIQTKINESKLLLDTIIEKPEHGKAPTNLANVSKYILPKEIFHYLQKIRPNEKSGEYYLTDALILLAKASEVAIHIPSGEYLDCGNVFGWLKTNLIFAQQDPELWKQVESFLAKKFNKE